MKKILEALGYVKIKISDETLKTREIIEIIS